jgi:hypothetical protein
MAVCEHKWAFLSRFRAGAYSWKATRLACQRLREAVAEIKKVAKKDPIRGAEGAVRLMEKIWPALEHVDSSSGALGSAVNKALDALIPILVNAPVDEKTRDKWLDRFWQAMADDGVDYLSPVGDRWGELCGSPEVAGCWADELVSTLRCCWSDRNPGGYFHHATVCLSCLLVSGRYGELLDLLELPRYPSWHYRRYAVEALLTLGRKGGGRPVWGGLAGTEPAGFRDRPGRACEEILISSGMYEDAYRCYGLSATVGSSYISRFRAVAKRCPMKDKSQILSDLIATTPGEEGKWFATAKELELYDLALELANRSPCDPKTLTRAARDYLDLEPAFALGSAIAALRWLSEGWGYEVKSIDVVEAYDRAIDATARLNKVDNADERIRQLVEASDNTAVQFVRKAVQRRMRATCLR